MDGNPGLNPVKGEGKDEGLRLVSGEVRQSHVTWVRSHPRAQLLWAVGLDKASLVLGPSRMERSHQLTVPGKPFPQTCTFVLEGGVVLEAGRRCLKI